MNLLRGLVLFLTIGLICSWAGTVQRLPALPNGATAQALRVDPSGNTYVAGSLAPQNPKSALDKTDAFAAKLSPDGSQVLYFTVLGGASTDAASALAVGPDGSVYLTGSTSSSDFPVTKGALDKQYSAVTQQAFAAKLDPAGAVQYATYLGGTVDTYGVAIAVDGAGDAFVLGGGAPPAYQQIAGGSANLVGFVVKVDPTGSKALVSFTGLAGSYIAVDGQGAMYITGSDTASPPFTPGAFQTSQAAQVCGHAVLFSTCQYEYVAKVDPTGTQIVYLTGLNGFYGATPAGIAVDGNGDAIVAGATSSPDFPVTAGAFESIYAPVLPAVVTKSGPPPATGFAAELNASGSALVWSTFYGGSASDSITSMSMDSSGGILLGGLAGSSDLPGLSDVPYGCRPSPVQAVAFAVRLTPDGTSASPAQLFYGDVQYIYGNEVSWPIAVASPSFGSVIGLERTGILNSANLFAPARLACVTDPADNVQLASVAPGQDVSLFGTSLAPTLTLLPGQVPVPPEGVNATFGGDAATVLYASPGQVNLEVPNGIAGQTTVQLHVANMQAQPPLEETQTLSVVAQQPSVFLTVPSLEGAPPSCAGPQVNVPAAIALNADGSLNSPSNPALVGSLVTIFLNGAAPGAVVTGLINGNAASFTTGTFSQGALPVSFQVPPSGAQGMTISQLTAGGTSVRENFVAVCTSGVPAS